MTDIGEIKRVIARAVEGVFGSDRKRIDHAHRVMGFAEELMRGQPVDAKVVVTAALLHDIGIKAAEAKHGSSAPKHQEIEGPPVARGIMEGLGYGKETIEHVCRIIGSHHSAAGIDTAEFRIIWDADWLVNLPDEFSGTAGEKLERLIERVFKTEAGGRKARELFLGTAGIEVDVKGQTCPVPLVETRKALRRARAGEMVTVTGTHPASKKEIPLAVDALGSELVSVEEEEGTWKIKIRK